MGKTKIQITTGPTFDGIVPHMMQSLFLMFCIFFCQVCLWVITGSEFLHTSPGLARSPGKLCSPDMIYFGTPQTGKDLIQFSVSYCL